MSSVPCAHLDVRELPHGDAVRREARIQIDGRREAVTWRYDISGGEAESSGIMDGYIHSALFYLLKLGLPLRVHGSVSEDALYNLDELMRAWSQWRPGTYRHFELRPDAVTVRERLRTGRAIATYSGGMDANFTLARNTQRRGAGGYDVRSVLMVHGFDVDYHDQDAFARLVERLRPILAEFQVGLKTIRTDSKLLDQDWEDSFGAQLSGCLHQFATAYDAGLIASSEPYVALVTPLGSSPLTDRLFSSGAMNIVHDGAQFTRTAKAELLRDYPTIMRGLRVCWEGSRQYENCGLCEKCVRTRLNFMAVGLPDPACFTQPFEPSQMRHLRARNAFQLGELRTLLQYAEEHALSDAWVGQLKKRVRTLTLRRTVIDSVRGAQKKLTGPGLKQLSLRWRR